MFEQNTPVAPQTPSPNPLPPMPPENPLNPVMSAPGMPVQQTAPMAPPPFVPPPASVHTMPERFRASGAASGGGKPGSSKTKKLVITLIVVIVVAGLGVAGLYLFNKTVVKTNTNNTNTAINTNTAVDLNVNTANENANITNENTNTSTIINDNTNTTTNSNLNTNTATNDNSNVNVSTNTNTTVSTAPLPSSLDTDTDGLTDVEETIYTTDKSNPDTDGDTFIDGRKVQTDGTVIGELANLYNPKGAGTLEASTLVKRVQNTAKTFSLLIPTAWTTNESSGLLVITPTTQTGEFFQVRVYDNTTSQTLSAWYQANNPTADMTAVKTTAINGLEALISADGANVYFLKDAKIYGLTYTATGLAQLNYWTTFTMMMKSFKLVTA